jgi:hypothetical protein
MKALFLIVLALPLQAATYHVTTTGNDATGNGSESAPWASPQKAVDSVAPGDVILIGSGTFAAPVIKTIAGTDTGRITLDGKNKATLNTRLDIRKPYWTVQNLEVRGLASPVAHVAITNGAHFTHLLNLLIDNEHRSAIPPETTYHHGIEMSSTGGGPFNPDWPSNCRIAGCTITRVKGAVAITTSGANNIFEGNKMFDLIQADNFRLFGENHIVRGNECWDNRVSTAGSVGFHGDFIQCFGGFSGSRGHIIENNYVHDNEMQIAQTVEGTAQLPALIGTGATSNHTWRNNLFVRNQLGCSVTLPGGKWLNNTFYQCATVAGHVINLGEGDRGTADGTQILNNIFLDCGDPEKDSVGWYGASTDIGLEVTYIADHNFVSKRGFLPVRTADVRSTFRFHEENGINGGNPSMVSLALGREDYHLMPVSILIGKGKPLDSFQTDYDGVPRGATWDVGAYEAVALVSPAEAFQLPTMTRAQRDALTNAKDGMIFYQSDSGAGLRVREAGAWVKFTSTAD